MSYNSFSGYKWEMELQQENVRSISEPSYMSSNSNLCMTAGCSNWISDGRWNLGFRTCLRCGEKIARQQAEKHTVVPMHKSNYVHVTAEASKELLQGINNKSHRG
jgi:hypothetical protein